MMYPTILGPVVTKRAELDADGNVISPAEWDTRFHVNLPTEDPALADYLMDPQPTTPVVVYQGGYTPVCYRFPDENTFRQFYPEEPVDAP